MSLPAHPALAIVDHQNAATHAQRDVNSGPHRVHNRSSGSRPVTSPTTGRKGGRCVSSPSSRSRRKHRVVPVANRFFDALGRYLHDERPPAAATDRVFVVLKGPRRGQPLTAEGLDEVLDGARRRSGLEHATFPARKAESSRLGCDGQIGACHELAAGGSGQRAHPRHRNGGRAPFHRITRRGDVAAVVASSRMASGNRHLSAVAMLWLTASTTEPGGTAGRNTPNEASRSPTCQLANSPTRPTVRAGHCCRRDPAARSASSVPRSPKSSVRPLSLTERSLCPADRGSARPTGF